MRTMLLLSILTLTLSSCQDDTLKYEKIVGTWKCTNWVTQYSDQNQCRNNVRFTFYADKTYSSVLGVAQDTGTYQFQLEKLIAKPMGKLPIGVKMSIFTEDTLQFQMNNGGAEESLTLLKQ